MILPRNVIANERRMTVAFTEHSVQGQRMQVILFYEFYFLLFIFSHSTFSPSTYLLRREVFLKFKMQKR